MRRSYFFWYYVFQVSISVEGWAVRLRELSQRRKMDCVPKVPGYWQSIEKAGW